MESHTAAIIIFPLHGGALDPAQRGRQELKGQHRCGVSTLQPGTASPAQSANARAMERDSEVLAAFPTARGGVASPGTLEVFFAVNRQTPVSVRKIKSDLSEHLVASHTKPWRDSTNKERLDGENGLLLTPTIDHLFDKGFI